MRKLARISLLLVTAIAAYLILNPGQTELFESAWVLEKAPFTRVPVPTAAQQPLTLMMLI